MYAGKSYEKAVRWAQANADRTGTPRYIFHDTSGNIRIERSPPKNVVCDVVKPKRKETQ